MNSNKKPEERIQLLWNQIVEIWCQSFDVKKKRIKLKLNSKEIPELSILDKATKRESRDFEVFIQDKDIMLSTKDLSGAEVLCRFIDIVGVDNVRSLNFEGFSGQDLVDRDGRVYTKTSNQLKAGQIRLIIEKLGLKAKVIEL